MLQDAATALMRGAYDLHIHTKPSHFQRLVGDFELMRQAEAYEMAGVMIKSHYEPTEARAALINQSAYKGLRRGGIELAGRRD